jgi:molecular chaperone GrpE
VSGNNGNGLAGSDGLPEARIVEAVTADELDQAGAGEMAPEQSDNGAGVTVATLEEEKQELQDKLLRLAADFDNYRKRMIRERETSFKYAEESVLRELLPSIDNLERALAHQNGTDDVKSMRDGVDLTLKGLLSATAKFGLTPIASVGQPFDPNFHEALVMEESAEVPPQSVIREFEKGYFYKDRLLRAAKVVVAKSCE